MYRASVENRGDSSYHVTAGAHGFVLDTTEGRAVGPIPALLASLGGCVGHYVHDYLRDRKVPFDAFGIEVEGELAPDRSKLSDITVRIDLRGAPLPERQHADLLSYIERCPIHGTLRAASKVRTLLAQASEPRARPAAS